MPSVLNCLGLATTLFLPSAVSGAVIFSQFTIDEVSSTQQLQSGAGASDTAAVPAVTLEPAATGNIFAIHANAAQFKSILKVNPVTGAALKLTDFAAIAQQLGAPYGPNMTLTGGFSFTAGTKTLTLGDSAYGAAGEVSLVAINAETGSPSLVSRSTDLAGLSDHAALPDGTLAVARFNPAVAGTVNPTTGAFTAKINESSLLAAAPGTTSLPPEAIAVDPVSGKTHLFTHGDRELFEIANITAVSPGASKVTPLEMASADLHDLAVDQYGNLYGLDVATNHIFIVRSTDDTVFTFPLANIATSLGRPGFSAVPWRGIAARVADYGQTDLFLSSGDSNYGIVRVRFGDVASAVTDWTVY